MQYLDEKELALLTEDEVHAAIEMRGIPSDNYTREERMTALRVWLEVAKVTPDNGVLLFKFISLIQSKNQLE